MKVQMTGGLRGFWCRGAWDSFTIWWGPEYGPLGRHGLDAASVAESAGIRLYYAPREPIDRQDTKHMRQL